MHNLKSIIFKFNKGEIIQFPLTIDEITEVIEAEITANQIFLVSSAAAKGKLLKFNNERLITDNQARQTKNIDDMTDIFKNSSFANLTTSPQIKRKNSEGTYFLFFFFSLIALVFLNFKKIVVSQKSITDSLKED
jgi:hypothetical protein